MAWFKCGGGGIPAALKSLMNAVLNKKWGTSGTYPPETWPETVNLMGPLEEKTVSGSVVTFSDGADDVPIKSASFGIVASGGGGTPSTPVPIVGKSSVTVYQTGKNLFNEDWEVGGINDTTGLPNSDTNKIRSKTFSIIKGGTTCYVSVPQPIRVLFYASDESFISETANIRNNSFSVPSNCSLFKIRGTVDYGTTYNDDIMISYGSTASTYEAYKSKTPITVSLGQTVYGGTLTLASDGTLTLTIMHGFATFDGSEDESWALNKSGDIFRFRTTLSDGSCPASGRKSVLCNIGSFSTGNTEYTIFISNFDNKAGLFYIPPQTVQTVEDFKTWLSSNNMQVRYELATPIVITGLDEISLSTYLGDNNIWCDSGDTEILYRSSGTETIITPTLVTKAITENGTYTAAADNADGYSSVTVEVPAGPSNIETVLGSGVLIEVAGVSGTDVSRTMWTRTAAQDEKVVFHPNTQVKTNTGANDGYFKVLKNGVVVVSTYANTSTTTSFSIPDIDLEAGDVLTISVGFDNYHTSAWFDIWSTITILSSGSAPVLGLGLGNPGPVNETEEEPEEAPEEIQEETPEEVDQNESDE